MISCDQEKLNIPVWISIEETCKFLNRKVKTIKDKCRGEFVYKTVQNNRKVNYFIKFGSLPIQTQNRFFNINNNMCFFDYSNAPSWAKAQAEKYIPLIKATEFMRGVQIINYLKEWNICNPDCQTSYFSLMRMKQRYETDGVKGLLSKRGKSRYTTVKDEKSLFS